MANLCSEKKWNLYVLRYDYSGNYYVGTTSRDFKERMLDHLRRTSCNNNLPQWSMKNESTKGFHYYWFKVAEGDISQSDADWFKLAEGGISQSDAEKCEDNLAELLVKEKGQETDREIHIGNGQQVDRRGNDSCNNEATGGYPKVNSIDKKVCCILQNLSKLEAVEVKERPKERPKENFWIKCVESGIVGEYHTEDCNKSWEEFRIITYKIK